MSKKLLQTKELIKESMLRLFGAAIPGLESLSTFPVLVADEQNYPRFMWVWLIADNQFIVYSQNSGIQLMNERPPQLKNVVKPIVYQNSRDDFGNRWIVDTYSYTRETYDATTNGITTVQSVGTAVEYCFTSLLTGTPDTFEVLEAAEASTVDKQTQDYLSRLNPELTGFIVPVTIYGFPLESDYEYYQQQLKGIDAYNLRLDYTHKETKSYPVDLKNGVDYSSKDYLLYYSTLYRIERFVCKHTFSVIRDTIATRQTIYTFPKFKNMEDLLNRRDELFGCPMSDDDVKNFVKKYMAQVFTVKNVCWNNEESLKMPIPAKAIISGYADGKPQFKLLKTDASVDK